MKVLYPDPNLRVSTNKYKTRGYTFFPFFTHILTKRRRRIHSLTDQRETEEPLTVSAAKDNETWNLRLAMNAPDRYERFVVPEGTKK